MSEETKNPLIESFLKLHELAGGTYQDTLKPAERARRAQFSTPPAPAAAPPNPTLGSENMRFSSGSLTGPGPVKTGNPIAAGGGNYRPSIDVAPKLDNSASMSKARTDYQTRVAGVERQNPILAPGKLESGNLQVGSRGDSVKELQRKLGIKDDGIFGDDTAKKLREFQQKNNLKVDGIYGRQSASAMNKQSGMDALKKENPVGAYVSSQTVKPMSPMAGQSQGSNGTASMFSNASVASVRRNSPMPLSGYKSTVYHGGRARGGNYVDMAADSKNSIIYNNKPIDDKTYTFMQYLTQKSGQNAVERLKQQKLNQSYEEPEMTNKLIEAFMQLHSTNSSNLFTEAKKAKKLDPVGKEDEDIDNDGDKDKSDSYLHNRRKAIKAAMKEAKDPHAEGMVKAGTKAPEMVPAKDKAPAVSAKSDLPKDVANRMAGERKRDLEIGEKGSRQRSMIDAAKDAADRGGGFRTPEAIAKGTAAAFGQGIAKAIDSVAGYKKPESKVTKTGPNSSSAMKNEEVEQIDEALTAAHKAAIAKHVGKMWGKKGNISFNKEGGKHFVSHSDGIETHVHSIDMKKGVPHVTHFMTMQEEVEQLDEDEMYKGFMRTVHSHARSMSPKKFAKEYPSMAKHQNTIRNTPLKDVHRLKVDKDGKAFMYTKTNEEVEQIDEGVGVRNRVRKAILVGAKSAKNDKEHEINKNIITKLTGKKEAGKTYDAARKMVAKEEIEFSEAELEHIASILEANPIAPVPYEYSGAANGVSFRDLSDETVAEEEMKRGRGRPKGSKSGSKHGAGGDSTVETKNLASQIRFSRPSGGNFMLKHPTTGETKSVPAKAATEFYNKYTGAEKPAQKQAHHDEFLAKHFGSSEKPKKAGISLAKMPEPKS